jgi:hypothetical protein
MKHNLNILTIPYILPLHHTPHHPPRINRGLIKVRYRVKIYEGSTEIYNDKRGRREGRGAKRCVLYTEGISAILSPRTLDHDDLIQGPTLIDP